MPRPLVGLALVSLCFRVPAQVGDAASFRDESVVVAGETYRYRWLEPLPHLRGEPRPLVVYLHDADGRGADPAAVWRGLPQWLAEPAQRVAMPCFLLAVQCPADERWVDVVGAGADASPTRAARAVLAALDRVVERPGVDAGRVYLTGVAMGGFGAVDLAVRAAARFAAVSVVRGGGDPGAMARLAGVPIEFWHGADDVVIPPQRSRELVAALQALGLSVRHHEVPNCGDDIVRQAYGGQALAWLFAQDQRQAGRGRFGSAISVPRLVRARVEPGVFRATPTTRCVTDDMAAHTLLQREWPAGDPLPERVEADPRVGDVVVRVEPGAAVALALEVGEQLVVVVRDPAHRAFGAATAARLLATAPSSGCACGRYEWPHGRGGVLDLEAVRAPWSEADLRDAVQALAASGGDELVVPHGCAETECAALVAFAAPFGVRVQAVPSPSGAEILDLPWGDPTAIAASVVAVPCRFRLAAPPDAVCTRPNLAWCLATAAERATGPGAMPLASLWARLRGLVH